MKRLVLSVVGLLVVIALFLYWRRPEPPETPAARVTPANLVQLLTTNGKVEAIESWEVRARAPVAVTKVNIREGDGVGRGQLLAAVDDTQAREALARARAQLDAARADLALIERGGRATEIAELDAAIARARREREIAQIEVASLQRLVERQAAPRAELAAQQQKLRAIEADLVALEKKRSALIAPEDRERVKAQIRESEAAVAQAATALQQTEIRAPASGIVYALTLRPGAFYQPGELVAQIGVLDRVRVRVLVDEPELGRVQMGQPVRVTWDGLPEVSWQGAVERLPASVEMVGTRSVGEVLCTIDNPGRRLLPNVTVNADIRTGSAENALSIPREAVLREGEQPYVLTVDSNGVIVRKNVRLGIRDLTRVRVIEGLAENEIVLLPGDRTLSPGQKVQPKVTS